MFFLWGIMWLFVLDQACSFALIPKSERVFYFFREGFCIAMGRLLCFLGVGEGVGIGLQGIYPAESKVIITMMLPLCGLHASEGSMGFSIVMQKEFENHWHPARLLLSLVRLPRFLAQKRPLGSQDRLTQLSKGLSRGKTFLPFSDNLSTHL
jgi:hypothetical protein